MLYANKKWTLVFFLITSFSLGLSAQMDNQQMDKIIRSEATEVEGENGGWQMLYGDRPLLIITDETSNRMRIFTPVIEEKDLEAGQLNKMLEANFHSALDAKYSIYEGLVMSVYTHPLKELTETQLIDAMRQVVVLANTFGTTYNSTDMIFNPGGDSQKEKEKPVNKKPKKT